MLFNYPTYTEHPFKPLTGDLLNQLNEEAKKDHKNTQVAEQILQTAALKFLTDNHHSLTAQDIVATWERAFKTIFGKTVALVAHCRFSEL